MSYIPTLTPQPEPEAPPPSRFWPNLLTLAALLLIASAIAPYVHADRVRLGMLATYPPRLVYAWAALSIGALLFGLGRKTVGTLAVTAAAAMVFHIGIGGRSLAPKPAFADGSDAELTLLAFNIHEATPHASELRSLVDAKNVDFVLLQEVPPHTRAPFVEALDNFDFYWGDEEAEFEHRDWGPFASMVGVRRGTTVAGRDVVVETAITQYRTFAVKVVLPDSGPLWLVNVHSTKAFWAHKSVAAAFTEADYKSQWHVEERDALAAWLEAHKDEPVVVAGDFNAPYYAHNLRLPGVRNAHREVGRGLHVTFPAFFPVWGIDHTLGNRGIDFTDYRVLRPGYSDHLAQLATFRVRGR